MNICESLTVTARLFPDNIAITFADQQISYARLEAMSAAAGQQLAASGIGRGDRVALILPNSPAFPVWYYATLRIGAIAVSVSTRLAPSEVAFVVQDCEARACIATEEIMDSLTADLPQCVVSRLTTPVMGDACDGEPLSLDLNRAHLWVDTDRDQAALILYTSGTTGFAKGATLSHGNVRSNVYAFNHLCNMQPHDRILLALPLFHCFGQNALLNSALNVGATLVLQQKFDLNESKRLIAEHQVTQLYGVPMMFQLLQESCEPSDLASITYCFSAAATLPIQVSRNWQEKFGMPIYEGYGLTETSPFASYNHRIKFVPGSIGTPIDSVEMKIVDTETGEQCEPDELGEIAIRGPNVMIGYWNRAEDTQRAIRHGWFHSGDIGRRDKNGFFYIVDRVKDMITVGGLKVYPAEVERVLLDHPLVSQVAVVGVPDPVFGEQVIAFVRPADEALHATAIDSINDYAKQHLGNYKIPRRIELIDELPRNPSGKILKTVLRERASSFVSSTDNASAANVASHLRPASLLANLQSTHPSERPRVATEFVQQLVQAICQITEPPDAETGFLDAGLDSLMLVELSAQVQVELGREVPATMVFDHPRICDLADFLCEQLLVDSVNDPPAIDPPAPVKPHINIKQQIEDMTEEQALQALMAELEE